MQCPNYSEYSIEELEDASRHIDRAAYPDRARSIDEELKRRVVRSGSELLVASDAEPKRGAPWPVILGVAGLLVGVIGFKGSLETALAPAQIEAQRATIDEMVENVESTPESDRKKAPLFWMLWDSVARVMAAPPWYKPYAISRGATGVGFNLVCIIGGILSLLRRQRSSSLLLIGGGGMVVLAILDGAVMVIGFGFPVAFIALGLFFGIAMPGALVWGAAKGGARAMERQAMERSSIDAAT